MNEMQVFQNADFGEFSILELDGRPLFPATRSAKILGYKNPQEAIRDHCKGVRELLTPTEGGPQTMNFIPEGDLYRLIVKSQLPTAEKFERWVFDEVLPSIRNTGAYSSPTASTKPRLGEVNSAARLLDKSLRDAGVPPEFRIMTMKGLYETVGVNVFTQGAALHARTYEATEMAERLNLRSKKGNPHAQAIGAIIEKVGYSNAEKVIVPFSRNGHSGTGVQFAESVLQRVDRWVRENGYPETISHNGKTLSVYYS